MNLVPVEVVARRRRRRAAERATAGSYRALAGERAQGAARHLRRGRARRPPQHDQAAQAASAGRLPGKVYTVEPTGDITYVHVHLGSTIVVVSVDPDFRLAPDEPVWIEFDQDRIHLFDGEDAAGAEGR